MGAAGRRPGPATAARRPRRRRPRWLRAIRWAITALFAWIVLSVILFIVSSFEAQGVPASAVAALEGGGLPPFSATTILVLGSTRARPGARSRAPTSAARAART